MVRRSTGLAGCMQGQDMSGEGGLERLTRLELALRAWKALVLPLHHSRLYPGRTNPSPYRKGIAALF